MLDEYGIPWLPLSLVLIVKEAPLWIPSFGHPPSFLRRTTYIVTDNSSHPAGHGAMIMPLCFLRIAKRRGKDCIFNWPADGAETPPNNLGYMSLGQTGR